MKQKGFTLIELLTVVIILAIILAITIPTIMLIFQRVRINAFTVDANMVLRAINLQKQRDPSFNELELNENNIEELLKIGNKNYQLVSVTINEEGKPQITIVGKNKWDCLVASGIYRNITVEEVCEIKDLGQIPVITILGDNPIIISAGSEYIDAGAIAYDEEDGDITNKIVPISTVNINIPGVYTVMYTVKDSDGNYANPKIREVYVVDSNIPVITILGSNLGTIIVGEGYVDAGATAYDLEDGDITENILVESNVNPNEVGTYTVIYTVTDSAGNPAVPVTRTVHVISSEYIASKGVNRPKLAPGMTAVKWNGTTWDMISNPEEDTSWYSYTTTDKMWANAMTLDGSMWVWIPRFIYKISNGWHSKTTGTIEIQFSMVTDDTRGGTVTLDIGTTAEASNNKWTNHPAFKFGDTELTGFWVAKFEASNNSGNVRIAPGVQSWRNITINDIFIKCRNMETSSIYGWGASGDGIDTHMMKNIEWGAIAYLSKSSYGKETEINNNSSTSYYTGGGSGNAYINNIGQSSTGNINGIYDLNGSADEYVADYLDNGHNNLTTYGNNLVNADEKYKDVYIVDPSDKEVNNYNNTAYRKGDAIWETSNSGTYGNKAWFNNGTNMPDTTNPFMVRGGVYMMESYLYKGIYAFNGSSGKPCVASCHDGGIYVHYGFRPVIAVDLNL